MASSLVSSGSSNVSHCVTDQPFWSEVLTPRFGHCLENPLRVLLPVMEGYAAESVAKRRETALRELTAKKTKGVSHESGDVKKRKNMIKGEGSSRSDWDTSTFGTATSDSDGENEINDAVEESAEPFAEEGTTDNKARHNKVRKNSMRSSKPSIVANTSSSGNEPIDFPLSLSDKRAGANSESLSLPPPPPIPHMPFTSARASPLSLSLLQHVLMYMCPLDQMRYVIPAMSSSWSSTACVERHTNRVVTHGSIAPPAVSGKVQYKSVVCGDTFIALLTANNEVQVAGHLETPPSQMGTGSDPQILRVMTSNKVKMLSGQGSKLFALTTAHTVRPLSVVPANTKTLFPYRLCKFLNTGLSDDCYMVGFDNILYKTTASQRALGTPRRVMTMNKVGVSRVAAGAGFLIVIDLAGRIYTMGKNKKGQLGNGKKQDSMRKPYLHAHLQHHFFVSAAAGDLHSLILTSSGVVYAAGCNNHGQLGLGKETLEVLTFTPVPLPARCTSITAGPSASMFACADGRVYVCGFNELGMLGVDSVSRAERVIFKPLPLLGIERGIVEMVLDNFSLATAVRSAGQASIGAGAGAAGAPNGVGGPIVSGAVGGSFVPGMPHASGFGHNGSSDVFIGGSHAAGGNTPKDMRKENKVSGGCCCVTM